MIKTKKQMFAVIGVFALVMMLGTVTYAFFNYTRTGVANTISTGQINFSTTQSSGQNGYINLTNVFPVNTTNGIPDNSNVGTVTINVTGDTEYTGGIEYLVSAANVTNTVGNKTIPISINVTATSGLGTEDEDYFTNRGINANTSIYKVLASDTISNNDQILVGYIKSGETGVNGNVVIKAYLDDSKIAISDTYYENVPTISPNDQYGTPASFGEGKVVLTTTEWNGLEENGISFQVKVEAKENTWVDGPVTIPTVLGCNGCKFIFTENEYNFSDTDTSTIGDFETNNETLVDDYRTLNKNVFLGFEFNGSGSESVITHAYACGIKRDDPNDGTAFCIEGSTDGSTFASDKDLITGATLWNDSELTGNCSLDYYGTDIDCTGMVIAGVSDVGSVYTEDINNYCQANYDGEIFCGHY